MSDLKVFLPHTSFPMKGQLPLREPEILNFWEKIDLYKKQREARQGQELKLLHDGPPYANGHIHLGHALNKVLKDFVNRWHFMQGFDFSFIPGWDCHGLPIEAKIEEKYQKEHKNKKDIAPSDFRQDCRDFAMHWVKTQSEEFQRLGVTADYTHPYLTMSSQFEAGIVQSFFKLVEKNMVYQGIKPVMWSFAEETALAEAEIEYKDIVSDAIYVRFPITNTMGFAELEQANAVIWTTTPWSLPGNRAICYQSCAEYCVIVVAQVAEKSLVRKGEKFLIAKEALDRFCKAVGILEFEIIRSLQGTFLHGISCQHPLFKEGYTFDVPLFPGEHVTTDTGTGLVHTAPAHGIEDFLIGQTYCLEVPETINGQGFFTEQAPLFTKLHAFKSFLQIKEALIKYGALVKEEKYTHSYPHSWRSKTPLIYRTTPQWFIALDGPYALRQKALDAIEEVRFLPDIGKSRIKAMVQNRPDWCISRQRIWGVPLPLFVHAHTGELLVDPQLFEDIVSKIEKEGCDFWFTKEAFDLLPEKYRKTDWIKINDILDVWFESGVTHEVVLKDGIPKDAIGVRAWPANFYLEGSDQHRGWFQSSLLTGVGLHGQAPFEALITHGFLLDEEGYKMSKSLGNTFAPSKIIDEMGADLLRLWVAHEDYHKDLRIGPMILKHVEDIYRRLRNTLRYLLGGMNKLELDEIKNAQFSPLDRYIHHKLYLLNQEIEDLSKEFDFQSILQKIHLFCTLDLSSFYFEISKDSLYCDPLEDVYRSGIRTTFLYIFLTLSHWLAPLLCFTTEQAFQAFGKDILKIDDPLSLNAAPLFIYLQEKGFLPKDLSLWSIHLSRFVCLPKSFKDDANCAMIERLKRIRKVILSALEQAREKKQITNSLYAAPVVYLSAKETDLPLDQLKALCLTSDMHFVFEEKPPQEAFVHEDALDIAVVVHLAEGAKCLRCWKILPEVEKHQDQLCERCDKIS